MEHESRRFGRERGQREPSRFQPQTTTVWSFPERGSWATHDGSYRGNWSPYIPRNLLLHYTQPGDLVVDPFVGGGTSAVEAALLGRRAVVGDLNTAALAVTRRHVDSLRVGTLLGGSPALLWQDARALAVADGTAQLVLLHPPYADAIPYSKDTPGDLSRLRAAPFIESLRQVAAESTRVLAPGGRCALLMGDLRRHGRVVPLGFAAIHAMREAGLVLDELIIKRQHHTRMERAWAPVSTERGFLLLAHEYLAVFRRTAEPPALVAMHRLGHDQPSPVRLSQVPETHSQVGSTTVWSVPSAHMDSVLPDMARRVLMRRSNHAGFHFVQAPVELAHAGVGPQGGETVPRWLEGITQRVPRGGTLVVETRDLRVDGALVPMGLEVCRELYRTRGMRLKEIIVVVPAENLSAGAADTPSALAITHRYLVVVTLHDQR